MINRFYYKSVIFVALFLVAFLCVKNFNTVDAAPKSYEPSTAQEAAFLFYNLRGMKPNFKTAGYSYDEINILEDLYIKSDPKKKYLSILGVTPYSLSQSPTGLVVLDLGDFNENFEHPFYHKDLSLLAVAPELVQYREHPLTTDQLNVMLAKNASQGTLNYFLQLRLNFASPETINTPDKGSHYIISGDIALLDIIDEKGTKIYSYQASWYGLTVSNELNSLYYKNKNNGSDSDKDLESKSLLELKE